jgi:hypothetical protein
MASRPFQQGGLDGLCGLYSIVNAVEILHAKSLSEKHAETLFKRLALKIGSKFPAALWDGTGVPELREMLDEAQLFAKEELNLSFERHEPFHNTQFSAAKDFRLRLSELITPPSVAIVGLFKPWDHWTVVDKAGKDTLFLFDSIAMKRVRAVDIAIKRNSRKTYVFDIHQTFVLTRSD